MHFSCFVFLCLVTSVERTRFVRQLKVSAIYCFEFFGLQTVSEWLRRLFLELHARSPLHRRASQQRIQNYLVYLILLPPFEVIDI